MRTRLLRFANKAPARRLIALAVAVAVVGGGGAALRLANSAGAATPAVGTAASARNPHVVPMAPSSTAPVSGHAGPVDAGVPSTGRKPGEQLSATQLPAAAAEKWTAVGEPSTRAITGHDIRENECVSVNGATTWTQQGFNSGGGQTAAIQDTFAFGSSGEAQAAYRGITAGMAQCQTISRAYQRADHTPADAVVRQTASLTHAVAWERTWTGVMGMSAGGPQTNHLYVAAGGPVLIVLQFTQFPGQATPYNVAGDPQVLAMLEADVAR